MAISSMKSIFVEAMQQNRLTMNKDFELNYKQTLLKYLRSSYFYFLYKSDE